MAAKKKHSSKTAFVLGFPHDMPAAEIVAKGSEAGVSLTPAHVHAIRSLQRKKDGGLANGAPTSSFSSGRRAGAGANKTAEDRFIALALDVGLVRAEELIAKVRSKMPALLR